jgi:hypothetical protein
MPVIARSLSARRRRRRRRAPGAGGSRRAVAVPELELEFRLIRVWPRLKSSYRGSGFNGRFFH